MHKFYKKYIIQAQFFPLLPIKNKRNDNKHVICQLYNMQLQKLVKSSPAVKKCVAPKNDIVKKDVKSKVAAKKWL